MAWMDFELTTVGVPTAGPVRAIVADLKVYDAVTGLPVNLMQNGETVNTIATDATGRVTFQAQDALVVRVEALGWSMLVESNQQKIAKGTFTGDLDTAVDAGLDRAEADGRMLSPEAAASTYATQVAVAGKVSKGELLVNATDYGVKADGTTDDTAALAAAFAAGTRVTLPANAVIAVATKVSVPAGAVLYANGATIKGLPASVGNFLLEFGSNTRVVGILTVEPVAGTSSRGVVIESATDTVIDALVVKTATPGSGASVNLNHAVRVGNSQGVIVGRVAVTNFDYPLAVLASQRVTFGQVDVTGYVCGLQVRDSKGLRIDGGRIRTASPNAAYSPGHNGVLLESTLADYATESVWLTGLIVEDAGEHAFRLGGQLRIRDVWHDRCVARNVGGSGFKALGGADGTSFHENIFWDSCVVEDAGQDNVNKSGFLIERVIGGALVAPVIRRRNKPKSCYVGIRFNQVDQFTTTNPSIQDTASHGYEVAANLGNANTLILRGGSIIRAGGAGIHMEYSGRTFRRVNVYGRPLIEAPADVAFRATNTGGGALTGGAFVEFDLESGTNVAAGATGGYMADVVAAFQDVPFANGSLWRDRAGGVMKKRTATGWVNL